MKTTGKILVMIVFVIPFGLMAYGVYEILDSVPVGTLSLLVPYAPE